MKRSTPNRADLAQLKSENEQLRLRLFAANQIAAQYMTVVAQVAKDADEELLSRIRGLLSEAPSA